MTRERFSGALATDLGTSRHVGFADLPPGTEFRQDHHTLGMLSPLGYFFIGTCYAEATEWAAGVLGSGVTPQLLFDRNILWVRTPEDLDHHTSGTAPESALRIAHHFTGRWRRIRSWNHRWVGLLSQPPDEFGALAAHLRQVRWYMRSAWRLHFLLQFALRAVMEQALSELAHSGRQFEFLDHLHSWPSDASRSALLAKHLLETVPQNDLHAMRRASADYVSRAGDRTCGTLDVSTPTLAERPSLLQGLAATLDDQLTSRPREPHWVRKNPLLHLAWKANYFWWSEDHNTVFEGQSLIPLRRTAQQAGRLLGLPDDLVFWLFMRELEGALDDHSLRRDVFVMAHARGSERANPSPARGILSTHLSGQAASPGIAQGIAHVRLGIDDRPAPDGAFVLVANGVASNWLPLLEKAVACVVSQAGITSHAAIICRQLGIPCVVGVTPSSISRGLEGREVSVDGALGAISVR